MTSNGPLRRPAPPRERLREGVARIRAADAAIEEARQAMTRNSQEKQRVIRELYLAGFSYTEIARELGVSVQRVYGLSRGKPRGSRGGER